MLPIPPSPNSDPPDRTPSNLDEAIQSPEPRLTPDIFDEELVTVATYPFANEAELARLHLEEEGIRAVLVDAETVNMDWVLGNAVGYIKVQVLRSHALAATAILVPPERLLDEESSGDSDRIVCLACKTEIPESEMKCFRCGWSYGSIDEGIEEA